MTSGAPVSVGKFVVIQMTDEVYKQFKEAYDEGDVVDFSEVNEDDIKIVAEFDGIGLGVLV